VSLVPESTPSLPELLQTRVLVLDGAVGTELERRGVCAARPLWSAAALDSDPRTVLTIHRDYVRAGADIIVANTFRTNVRTLRAAGMFKRGPELNRAALNLAWWAPRLERLRLREISRPPHEILIAASLAPVEDCYRPQRAPELSVLYKEHRKTLAWLKTGRPALVWIETMNTVREARAAARAAKNAKLPFVLSFVLAENGDLLSGEPLPEAVAAVEPFNPLALGLNCIPPDGITAHLPRLRRATKRPLAAYAHINNREPTPGWNFSQSATPDQYARQVKRWLDLGVTIVGGCCGTTPDHIRAVREVVERRHGG
jgi:S-methylmethionine-dependent homocysteine/selenocysteine methylase